MSAVDDPTTPPVESDPCWSDTLLALLEERARFLEQIGYGHLARDVLAWVRANRELFDEAGDAVLTHGNYFGEHVSIADNGTVTAVIDFEHALAAPAEWDYLRTVLPVFGPSASHDVPESVFREAYESVRPLPAGFDRRREAYVLCNVVSYIRSLHLQRGDQDPTHDVARRAHRMADSVQDRLDALAATPSSSQLNDA